MHALVGVRPTSALQITIFTVFFSVRAWPENLVFFAGCCIFGSWWTFRIFSILAVRGAGEREEVSKEVAGGGPVLIKKSREGGGHARRRRGRGRAKGGGNVCGEGGGLNIFCRGRNAQ